VEVFFDDFKVTQNMSDIVAGADYYPFGLPIAERELTREPYRYGYQGQFSEKDKETGFNFFDLRLYDSRIGRFTTADPYSQYWSSYVGMGNMPHMGTDPDGGLFGLSAGWSALAGAGIGFAAGAGAALLTGHEDDWWKWGLGGAAAGGILGYATGTSSIGHGSSNARSVAGGKFHTNEYSTAFKSIGNGARFVEWQELTFILARTSKQIWDREEEYSQKIKFERNTKKAQFEFSEIWGTAEQSVSRNGSRIWKRTTRKDDYTTPIFNKKGGDYTIKHKQRFPSKSKPESTVNEDGDVVGESNVTVYPTLDLQVTIRRLIHGRRGKTLSYGWRKISAPN
jgi:RHS repeat-associated protein